MPQIARCEESYRKGVVIYRHSISGATKAAMPGEKLPPEKSGTWEALACDNVTRDGTLLTFIELIGASLGPIIEFEAGFMAEVGMTVNLRGEIGDDGINRGGLYRIDQSDIVVRKGDDAFHICVRRIGDIDPKKLIYEVRFA